MSGIIWRRSSFCANGECVEVAWVTATRSGRSNCVEVGTVLAKSSHSAGSNCIEAGACACGCGVLVRDSKDKRADAPILAFDRETWATFIAGIKAGDFTG